MPTQKSFSQYSYLNSVGFNFSFSCHTNTTKKKHSSKEKKTKNLQNISNFNQWNFENAQNFTLDLLVYKSTREEAIKTTKIPKFCHFF